MKLLFLAILSILIININGHECPEEDVECHEKEKYKKGINFKSLKIFKKSTKN